MRKISAIFQLLEAIFELFRAWFQVRHTRFSSWSGLLAAAPQSESPAPSDESRKLARLICARIERIGRPFGERLTCLIKAIAAKRMLSSRSIATSIRIGINKSTRNSGGIWEAHAWLDLGDQTILGGDTKAEYIKFRNQDSQSGANHGIKG